MFASPVNRRYLRHLQRTRPRPADGSPDSPTVTSLPHRGRTKLRPIAPALLAALVLFGSAVAGPARGAVIEGRVVAPPSPRETTTINPYPGRAHTATPDAASGTPAPWGDVVVYLEGKIAGVGSPRPKSLQLAQRGRRFEPRVLPILVGEKVSFPNFDPFYHNVFSYSPVRRFDLGKYGEGESNSISFPEPGEVRIFCDIHSEMNAVILVLENPFFARPDAEGQFRLEGVPPGRYELVVWHPDHPARRREVVVPSDEALVLGF